MYIKIDGAELSSFSDKEIILFGASSTGVKALEEFKCAKAVILGFCDNDEKKHGTKFCGYLVYSPEEIKKMTEKNTEL